MATKKGSTGKSAGKPGTGRKAAPAKKKAGRAPIPMVGPGHPKKKK